MRRAGEIVLLLLLLAGFLLAGSEDYREARRQERASSPTLATDSRAGTTEAPLR